MRKELMRAKPLARRYFTTSLPAPPALAYHIDNLRRAIGIVSRKYQCDIAQYVRTFPTIHSLARSQQSIENPIAQSRLVKHCFEKIEQGVGLTHRIRLTLNLLQ
jgi:hypothetical protein